MTRGVVMLATVAVTVATDNLAAGVAVGVLLSGVFFTFKVSRLLAVTRTGNDALLYRVSGQVFFASADLLVDAFDVREVEGRPVTIDVSHLGAVSIAETHTLSDDDIYAKNTLADQDRVTPSTNETARIADGTLTIALPAVSWTAIALA